jgi:hypothetical protein
MAKYKGQSKKDFNKNYTRIEDIVKKSDGDKDKEIRLAQTQADRITDEYKCINRAMAAKEMGHEHLFDVFFRRGYEIGAVGKQEFRDYQLEQLGF